MGHLSTVARSLVKHRRLCGFVQAVRFCLLFEVRCELWAGSLRRCRTLRREASVLLIRLIFHCFCRIKCYVISNSHGLLWLHTLPHPAVAGAMT